MTRDDARRLLVRLQSGMLTPSERQRALDEVLVALLTVYVKITPDNLPEGPRWDADGACYKAVKIPTPEGWYWHACNEAARAKGYQGQELFDFYPLRLTANDGA